MDNNRPESYEDDVRTERLDAADEETVEGPAAASLIAANLAGVNAGLSTNLTGAPSAGNIGGVSAAQAAEVLDDDEALNLDALEQFGSRNRQTGDEGVSPEQRELEADELNG